ncbi:MAG: SRPBCC family protein [Anaerolineae bacterium]|jgi:uncharacterized membrane protein
MAKLKKTITIDAPVEDVFGFISEPANLVEIWPSMVEAKDVQRLPNGGSSFRWVYKMAGIRLEGFSEDTEVVPNERVVSETKDGIESTIKWMCRPKAGGTEVTFEAEYKVPVPVLGKVAEAFIVKANEGESELLLANLKARMEV